MKNGSVAETNLRGSYLGVGFILTQVNWLISFANLSFWTCKANL